MLAARRKLAAEAKFCYQFSHALTPTISIAMIVVFLTSYFVEKAQAGMYFDTLQIRLFISFCILMFLLRGLWPKALYRFGHITWLFFVGLLLPYCYGSIVILNAAMSPPDSSVNLFTVTEYVLSSFFLVQVVFHIPLILAVWVSANCLVFVQLFFLQDVNTSLVITTSVFVLPFLVTVLFVGGIINRSLFNFQRDKEQAVWNVANAIAHQLRTPLATIRILSAGSKNYLPALVSEYRKALEENKIRDPISTRKLDVLENALNSITNEVQHSGALINILIANSKPFEYRDSPKNGINVRNIIHKAIATYPYNSPHERSLVTICDGDDFEINALENMMLHVMFNLIANAVEFSQKRKGGRIRIWYEQNNPWNKVYVRDTGIGIPRKYQHLIFDPFFSRNSLNGTGIGLSFCKSVMEGIGGKIECDSVEGEYCQFSLFFKKPTS